MTMYTTKKKGKRLSDKQKVGVYYTIDDEGLSNAVTDGTLANQTKGTSFGKLAKNAYKAFLAVEKAVAKGKLSDANYIGGLLDKIDDIDKVAPPKTATGFTASL